MSSLFLLFLFFSSSAALTGVYRSLALRVELLDLPVSRSAHSKPVPVGGGVVFASLFLLGISYLFFNNELEQEHFLALLGGALVALVGFVDDIKELEIQWRIIPQIMAAVWTVWWLGGVPEIGLLGWTLSAQWLLNGLGVLALVWLLNLYNFMDGIDGIAASELVFVNIMSLIFVTNTGSSEVYFLSLISLGSAAGFLLWNWSPAKIFMGDVGSGFIGFILGVLALLTMAQQAMTVWTWVILLAVFIVDSAVTLGRRFMAGEKWYQGHSSHAYQKAARRFNSHQKVTITITLINLVWLAPLAWLSVIYPELGIALAALAIVPLVVVTEKLRAGRSDEAPASTI